MSFTGTLDKCKACDKTVHVVDMLSLEGLPYHKTCFKCSHCKGNLVVCQFFFELLFPVLNLRLVSSLHEMINWPKSFVDKNV